MEMRLIQFSSVVVGEAHNPTILNPDFLGAEGIVPKSWGWKVAHTLTTPPLALVRYENGVTITVEQSKLQVADPNVADGPDRSKVGEIASAYVRTLRHVHYTAVGNNFQSVIQLESPDEFIKELFLRDGPWSASDRILEAMGVRLVYSLKPGRLTLSIDSGEARLRDDADKQAVVLSNANFSRDCTGHPAYEEVCGFLQMAMQDWAAFQSLLTSFIDKAE